MSEFENDNLDIKTEDFLIFHPNEFHFYDLAAKLISFHYEIRYYRILHIYIQLSYYLK
jgi:hypothetical protein